MPIEAARAAAEAGLEEDAGPGDITTEALIPEGARLRAVIRAKSSGAVAGLPAAAEVFRLLDPDIDFRALAREGESVEPGRAVAGLEGSARAVLTGERTALNILGRLSGIAEAARALSAAAGKYGVKVMDTRKTTPGLRALEKYAVSAGGGKNHRMGLYDAILIKDNHIKAAGGPLSALIRTAREKTGGMCKIEAEASSLRELEDALEAEPDVILLDNMSPGMVREAAAIARKKSASVKLEVSGGISLENAEEYASCGVDMISSGALTHSVKNFDFSMEVEKTA